MLESVILTAALAVSTPQVCDVKTVKTLANAGFQGPDLRGAWSIVWRESRFQNLGPGNPYFNGADYGWWQIRKPVWGSQPWWTDAAMLNPDTQSRIAYRMTKKGRDWRLWGLRQQDGKFYLDTTYYGGWSASQQQAWIIQPFMEGWNKYPRRCR